MSPENLCTHLVLGISKIILSLLEDCSIAAIFFCFLLFSFLNDSIIDCCYWYNQNLRIVH